MNTTMHNHQYHNHIHNPNPNPNHHLPPQYPTNITITTFNINGTNNINKIQKVIITKHPAIITLQETHTNIDSENIITNTLHHYWWIFNHGQNNCKGVAIPLPQHLPR